MARRRSISPELLLIKTLSALVIPIAGCCLITPIVQTALTQQFATIQTLS